jgi:hypothetical protein
MTYYADLTPYRYFDGEPDAVNVGWLEPDHAYATGEPPEGLVERLAELADDRVNQTRGYHFCGFCVRKAQDEAGEGGWFAYVPRGSAEFRVHADDAVYAAPTMIVHYVADHGYLPPQQFCEAVLRSVR